MQVSLAPFDPMAALFVAANMRAVDREEIFATRYNDDPKQFIDEMATVSGFSWVARRGDEPCAVIGARPCWPGVWAMFAFGTDQWDRVALSLTRHARRFMQPALERAGAHRAIAFSHAGHTQAHAWLRLLGAEAEASLPAWGRAGEDFILFAWRR